jgi:hypothetical protein
MIDRHTLIHAALAAVYAFLAIILLLDAAPAATKLVSNC